MDVRQVAAAADRFRAFFAELGGAFYEREEVIRQIELALLCREHALISGPPGTAKSQLASAVFGRIICEQSGEPSLYARQITESTVQTDLIGPIDFKNLMETGRTQHFTDEGMLGAAHAFLDEVFDGRDMLLRSALNVLQERELKEGDRITRGQIECALMTSNRYIADVVEHARQTLLAFIDRIAFIGFVPRGFADPDNMQRVLDRHVARAATSKLDALLTLQDLDVLQELVEKVHVSKPVCEALASLLFALDEEMNSAVRADPSFVPTRYLSTRTAVRSGKVLRAACVHDWIFGARERELQVTRADLDELRLHLLLAGPTREQTEALLARETDPNERRQLEIVRTEREVFERCLERVSGFRVAPLLTGPFAEVGDAPPIEVAEAAAADEQVELPQVQPEAEASGPLAGVEARIRGADAAGLSELIAELTPLVNGEDAEGQRARRLLEEAVAALNDRAFRALLEASAEPGEVVHEALARVVEVAGAISANSVSTHGLSRWLHGRALAMTDEAARYAVGARAHDLAAVAPGDERGADGLGHAVRRLDALERLAELRAQARRGAEPGAADDAGWRAAVEAVEQDVAALWDATFCHAVEQLLEAQPDAPLPDVLGAITPELGWLDRAAARLTALGGSASQLKAAAIGGRLTDLVASLMGRVEAVDRATLHGEIETVLGMLSEAKLAGAIGPSQWLRWAAEALLRAAPELPAASDGPFDYDGYQALRAAEQRVPVALALCEVALRVAPEASHSGAVAAAGLSAVAELLAALPDDLRGGLARLDLNRIERATSYLEGWWSQLCDGEMSAQRRLDITVRSRLFDVLWDDSALARFALEARLIADAMPEQRAATDALGERLQLLETRTRRAAQALLRSRNNEAWAAAIRS